MRAGLLSFWVLRKMHHSLHHILYMMPHSSYWTYFVLHRLNHYDIIEINDLKLDIDLCLKLQFRYHVFEWHHTLYGISR